MSEPPDKTRVIRLVKKPQQTAKAPAAVPPSEPPRAPARPQRRFDPPLRPPERPPWKKEPFPNRPAPRRPRVPPSPKPAPVVLTEEQRVKILDLYRGMVMAGERPTEGRRKKIADRLDLPYASVADVVRGYVTHERYRRTNFDIEKAYWQTLREGETNARTIARRIAERLRLEEGRIWWWLEKLHEPRKSFANDPEVEEPKRAAIVALYQTYLQQANPPEMGLHRWLAEQIGGLTARQVHKVLCEYRLGLWQSLEGTKSEPGAGDQPPPPTE